MPRARAPHVGPAARSRAAGVQLAWALDRAGAKVRAVRLAPADRRLRAPFTCLGCGEELVPHLGPIRTPHFSHRPGSSCPLTAPETALHLDTKERLLALCADAFAGRRAVVALARCPACRRVSPLDVGACGDRALPEAAVGPLRADVLVLAGAQPALAVEVRVTHAVEPAKEAALAAAGVPAIEVDAREEWEREGDGRTEIACARSLGFPPCAACRTRARADAERDRGGEQAEIAELEAYRARGLIRPQALAQAPDRPADPDAPLSPAEHDRVAGVFRCPDCGGSALEAGQRILRHTCADPAAGPPPYPGRPVAWRGYDGSLVAMGWWAPKRVAPQAAGSARARKPR